MDARRRAVRISEADLLRREMRRSGFEAMKLSMLVAELRARIASALEASGPSSALPSSELSRLQESLSLTPDQVLYSHTAP